MTNDRTRLMVFCAVTCLCLAASPATARQAGWRVGGGLIAGLVSSPPESGPIVGAIVEVFEAASGRVVATTPTDEEGRFTVGGLPAGLYTVRASLVGFEPATTPPVEVLSDRPVEVAIELRVAGLRELVIVTAPMRSTIGGDVEEEERSVSGRLLDVAPLPGDDMQALFALLPGVVRGPEGRLRIRGDVPSQAALLVAGVNVADPVTGEFAFELPNDAVEAVELLGSPYLAEYGRFSSGVATVRTRRAGDRWDIAVNNFIPRPLTRPGETLAFRGLRSFTPRLTAGGPVVKDRVWLTEAAQVRYVRTPVKSREGEPTIDLAAIDLFTRVDAHLSTRRTLTGGLAVFPRTIEKVTLATFVAPEATPDFEQRGFQAGVQDNVVLSTNTVVEAIVSVRRYDVDIKRRGDGPMVLTPAGIAGNFYNEQTRRTRTWQAVVSVSHAPEHRWLGAHLFRAGVDVAHSRYTGTSESGAVEIRRANGTLAELGTFGGVTRQDESSTDAAFFVQDRWRATSRLSVDLGLRVDRDGVAGHVNVNPRVGVVYVIDADARAVLRGGFGFFSGRTPYNVGALGSLERPTYASYDERGEAVVEPVRLDFLLPAGLETPSSRVWSVEVQWRPHDRLAMKLAHAARLGKEGHYLEPDIALGVIELRNDGRQRYREVALTTRYTGGPRLDLQASYVWSRARADLNGVDTYYGNFRWPVVRPNAYARSNTDVPHRLLVRGLIGLPWRIDLMPVIEWRTGFPWSAVNETYTFVGARNGAGRLPTVRTVDVSASRQVAIGRFRPRLGVRVFNLFGSRASRDVQPNVASPDFGRFFNPIERSFGVIVQFGR